MGFALIGIIMNTIKENFSFTVTTIVLMFFVAACLIFDLVKRKRKAEWKKIWVYMVDYNTPYGSSDDF